MWVYEKKLEYPIRIKNPNPKLAKIICTQYGGPDGELGASLRYLSQRFSMPFPELKAILTDIGTEELAHLEMVGTIVYQLTRNLTPEEIEKAGFADYFVDHTTGVYPQAAGGFPYSAASLQERLKFSATIASVRRISQTAIPFFSRVSVLIYSPVFTLTA